MTGDLAYTGEVLGELLYHEKVMEELEGEVYLLHVSLHFQ